MGQVQQPKGCMDGQDRSEQGQNCQKNAEQDQDQFLFLVHRITPFWFSWNQSKSLPPEPESLSLLLLLQPPQSSEESPPPQSLPPEELLSWMT